MKESVLDVLLYLFENVMHDAPDASDDRDSLRDTLLEAGFSSAGIRKAFDWLDDLAERRPEAELAASAGGPVRIYAEAESEKLAVECRGFLMFLETNGVLSASQRELVIERVMALEHEAIELDDLKLVVLMVLFNQPGTEEACAWLEAHMGTGEDVVN